MRTCVCVFVDVCVYVCACVLTLFLPIVTPLTLLFLFLPDKGHGIAMCKYGVSDLVKYKYCRNTSGNKNATTSSLARYRVLCVRITGNECMM